MSFSWNSLWKATLTEEDEDAYSAIKHMHVNAALKRQLDDRKKSGATWILCFKSSR